MVEALLVALASAISFIFGKYYDSIGTYKVVQKTRTDNHKTVCLTYYYDKEYYEKENEILLQNQDKL